MSRVKKIPHGWMEKPIFDVAPIVSKLVDPKLDEYSQLTLIAPDHIQQKSGQIIAKKTAGEQSAISGKYLAQEKDVIYSKIRPYLMKVAIAPEKCLCSADMYPLHCIGEIEPRYLHSILLSERFTYYANSCSTRTGIPKLNRLDMGGYTLTLPPLPEQKAIADLLSTWDEAIEKTEQLIQAKEKRLKKLSRSLLFGRKRLKNQKNDLDDGRFFKYPSDWGLATIGEVAKEISVRNGESEETVLSCSKYDGFVNSLDYFGKQVFSSDTSNYKVVKKGQFGYPSNHVEEGSIGLLEHCEKGIVSPIYVVFEAAKEKVHPAYLYKLLKTDIYRHVFQVSTSSSVDRRGSLRWGDFSKIKVLLPSLEEQQQIADTLSTAQQEIDLLKQLAEKYKTQKRGLMQKMLTGEWRIKPEIVDQYVEKDHE